MQRSGYDSHQAWQRARQRVIDGGSQRVATTLKITPAALQDALQVMLRR